MRRKERRPAALNINTIKNAKNDEILAALKGCGFEGEEEQKRILKDPFFRELLEFGFGQADGNENPKAKRLGVVLEKRQEQLLGNLKKELIEIYKLDENTKITFRDLDKNKAGVSAFHKIATFEDKQRIERDIHVKTASFEEALDGSRLNEIFFYKLAHKLGIGPEAHAARIESDVLVTITENVVSSHKKRGEEVVFQTAKDLLRENPGFTIKDANTAEDFPFRAAYLDSVRKILKIYDALCNTGNIGFVKKDDKIVNILAIDHNLNPSFKDDIVAYHDMVDNTFGQKNKARPILYIAKTEVEITAVDGKEIENKKDIPTHAFDYKLSDKNRLEIAQRVLNTIENGDESKGIKPFKDAINEAYAETKTLYEKFKKQGIPETPEGDAIVIDFSRALKIDSLHLCNYELEGVKAAKTGIETRREEFVKQLKEVIEKEPNKETTLENPSSPTNSSSSTSQNPETSKEVPGTSPEQTAASKLVEQRGTQKQGRGN